MNPLLQRLQPYPFERLRQLFAGLTPAPGLRPISLGIGEPRHATVIARTGCECYRLQKAVFEDVLVKRPSLADRMSRIIGQVGRMVAIVTVVSCAAFLALPFITGASAASQWMFFTATIVWTVTSSALRAPPIMLLGKYAAKPALPVLSAIVIVGYGLASASAPYLALTLRGIDPRIPFVLSSIALVLATFALAHLSVPTSSKSRRPLSTSHKTIPVENTSERRSSGALLACSGDM